MCQHPSHFPLYCLSWKKIGDTKYMYIKIKSKIKLTDVLKNCLRKPRGSQSYEYPKLDKTRWFVYSCKSYEKPFRIGNKLCITSSSKTLQTGNPRHMS